MDKFKNNISRVIIFKIYRFRMKVYFQNIKSHAQLTDLMMIG